MRFVLVLSAVDLPALLAPILAMISPRSISKETSIPRSSTDWFAIEPDSIFEVS
jgi:hypothetical protein